MSLISIVADPTVGGTFLAWSVHYLAGHTKTYHAASKSWVPVPNNPLTQLNAHNFKANRPNTLSECRNFIEALSTLDSIEPQTLYFHTLSNNLSPDKISTTTSITELSQSSNKIIRLALTQQSVLYMSSLAIRSLFSKDLSENNQHTSSKEKYQYFISTFFKESEEKWRKLGLTSTWDCREFLALNIDPFNITYLKELHNFNFNFFDLNVVDCWTTLDQSLNEIFDYLEISLDKLRLVSWQQTYNHWKKLHYQRIQFMLYYNSIVDNIISNLPMDLTRFNLDIVQEAAIQHTLIHKHNVNLKTWQLEKFIDTCQLHSLLEPNTHHKLNHTA